MPLLSSCEKVVFEDEEDEERTEEEEGEGTHEEDNLIICVSQIMEVPFRVQDGLELSDFCTQLNVAIYNDEKRLKTITQQMGDADFGRVGLRLEPGHYRVAVVAHSSSDNPSMTTPESIHFTNAMGFTDTFYYYDEVDVADTVITLNASLERAVSMLRIITTDEKPAEVSSMRVYYTGGSGELDVTTGYGTKASRQYFTIELPDSLTGKTLQIEAYTFLHAEEGQLNIQLTAYNKDYDVLFERQLDNVAMRRNHITQYRGRLFTDEPEMPANGQLITITGDGQWGGVTEFTF